jgi:hypothetical protein
MDVTVRIASMAVLTDSRWNREALRVEAHATYQDAYRKPVTKTVVRIFSLQRYVDR